MENLKFVDKLHEIEAAAKDLSKHKARFRMGVSEADVLSAAEAMDPKTDGGTNYRDQRSLQELKDTKVIPDVAKLSDEQIVQMMDSIFVLEAMVLHGRPLHSTVNRCVYFHDLSLTEGNAVVRAFCRGVIRTMTSHIGAIQSASVVEAEEFTGYVSNDYDMLGSVPLVDIAAELEAAEAATKHEGIKQRLRLRRVLCQVYAHVEDLTELETSLPKAHPLINEAIGLLASVYGNATQPTMDDAIFPADASMWFQTNLVVKILPMEPIADVLARHTASLQHLALLTGVVTLESIPSLVDFLIQFSELKPEIMVRSRAMMIIWQMETSQNLRVLGKKLFQEFALHTLTTVYGAPLYEDIITNKPHVVDAVAAYSVKVARNDPKRSGRLGMGKLSDAEAKKRMTIAVAEGIDRWLRTYMDVCFNFTRAMLSNRGRCHRHLGNLLQSLAMAQNVALDTESLCFGAESSCPQHQNPDQGCPKCLQFQQSKVLYAVTQHLTLAVADMYVSMTAQLGLLTTAEYTGTAYLQRFLASTHAQNAYTGLYKGDSGQLPPEHRKRGLAPIVSPALTSRTTLFPPRNVVGPMEARRAFYEGIVFALPVLERLGLINLALPERALTTPGKIFETRFSPVWQLHGVGILPYHMVEGHAKQLEDVDPKTALTRASNGFESCKNTLNSSGVLEQMGDLVASAKANAVSLRLLMNMVDKPDMLKLYKVTVGFQYSGKYITIHLAKA